MTSLLIYVLVGIAAAVIGLAIGVAIQKSSARSQAKTIIEEAQQESEMIKQKKLLEAREEELQIKAEAEKQANQRLTKIQAAEARIKQRELQLNQQQGDIARRRNENEAIKANLDAQSQVLESQKTELDKLTRTAQDTLEHISGLSADEAKEKLIESLRDEAKTAAASYINDIMDEAKLTANK